MDHPFKFYRVKDSSDMKSNTTNFTYLIDQFARFFPYTFKSKIIPITIDSNL